jgi:hypothetical protein
VEGGFHPLVKDVQDSLVKPSSEANAGSGFPELGSLKDLVQARNELIRESFVIGGKSATDSAPRLAGAV